MKRVAAIIALVYLAFLAEFVLYNAVGPWGKPALMVIVMVFCDLYWGIRFGILAAIVAGLLKDSFGIEPFGSYVFIFLCAAYLTTFVRKYLYQPGSRSSRLLVTFCALVGIFLLELFVHMRSFDVRIGEALVYILLPQLITTCVVATFVFQGIRNMVVKFKI